MEWLTRRLSGRKSDKHLDIDRAMLGNPISVLVKAEDDTEARFTTRCRIDAQVEVNYYKNGGISQTALLCLATEE